jgi:hypothetical protein
VTQMNPPRMQFEVLAANGFRQIAIVTRDDQLMLASGITAEDLPGDLGALVRARLKCGEIALASSALVVQ